MKGSGANHYPRAPALLPFKKSKALKNVGLMLVRHGKWSANIKTASAQHLVLTEMFYGAIISEIVLRMGDLKAFYNYYYFLI